MTRREITTVSESDNAAQFDYAILVAENLVRSADDINRIMIEAVDAGIESGRSIGVLEAYNVLIAADQPLAAKLLLQLIDEEFETRKTIADA